MVINLSKKIYDISINFFKLKLKLGKVQLLHNF